VSNKRDNHCGHETNSDMKSLGIAIAVAGENNQIAFSELKIRQTRVRDVWDGYVSVRLDRIGGG
jgi:hypothetical protein